MVPSGTTSFGECSLHEAVPARHPVAAAGLAQGASERCQPHSQIYRPLVMLQYLPFND